MYRIVPGTIHAKLLKYPGSHSVLPCLLFAVLLSSCATYDDSLIDHGEIEIHTPGYPNFHLNTYNELIPGEGGLLNMELSIPTSNLYFRRNDDDTFAARITKRITIEQQRPDDSDSYRTIHNDIHEDTLLTDNYDTTGSDAKFEFSTRYSLNPGNYNITVTVTDNQSGKDITRTREITVIDIQEEEVAFGDLRILTRREGDQEFKTEPGYHLNSDFDSLKTNFQLFVESSIPDDAELQMRLLRFNSDNTPARPPHHHTPLIGSLIYQGIDYNEPDTLHTVTRGLSELDGVIDIDFELPALPQGNYRVEVENHNFSVEDEDGNNEEMYRARDFSVMPSGFPNINDMELMTDALIYITRPGEYEEINASSHPDTLRKNFEQFFGELYSNRNIAKNVISSYFNRVEEANLLFSTHKQGWKTDPGMVYILFGQPDHQDHSMEGMAWHYYGSSTQQTKTFVFERSRNVGRAYPTENYILIRGRQFDRAYQNSLERWRRGLIY